MVSQKKILRQSVGLVPRVSHALVRAGTLFGAAQCFFGKIWQRGLSCTPVHVERIWALSKFVRVNQATAGLVVSVGRQMIVNIKLSRRLDCFRECVDQAVNFFLRWLGPGNRIGAGQSRKILPEAMSGNESMKLVRRIKVGIVVVPSPHVGTRSGHARALAEWFEQGVLIQIQKQIMIAIKLFTEWSFE